MTTVSASQKPTFNYDELMAALQKHEDTTSFEAQDMSSCVFEKDCEFGSLTFGARRLELTEWSSRQLCKHAGLSWGFFGKASSDLLRDTFREFLPGLKDPVMKLALKMYGKKRTVVRAVLPVDYPDLRNSQILEALGSLTVPFEIDDAPWADAVDSPVMRTRLVFKHEAFDDSNGDTLRIGIDIVGSELGACDLEENIIIWKQICANGMVATYGKKPFFCFNYKTTTVPALEPILKMSMERGSTDSQRIMAKVEKAVQTTVTANEAIELFKKMYQSNHLNKGVALQTIAAIEKDGCTNLWEAVNCLTSAARGYRDLKRLEYELAAGGLLGLNFDRTKQDADLAATRDPLQLPPSVLN